VTVGVITMIVADRGTPGGGTTASDDRAAGLGQDLQRLK
jgi:hypothetical protein